jgi:hypothetical protein
MQIVKDAPMETRTRAYQQLQWALQNQKVSDEIKTKIKATFEECNKKEKEAATPKPGDF